MKDIAEQSDLLFQPFEIAGFNLKNRIVHTSIFNGMASGPRLSELEHTYLVNRARGGASMLVTAPLGVSTYQDLPSNPVNSENMPAFTRLADSVRAADCHIIGQLQHSGRGSHYRGRKSISYAPSVLPDDLSWSTPVAMSVAQIQDFILQNARSAASLKNCGFSGVEISGGHGHIFHQFFSPYSNRREDRYGGDWAARVRIVADLIDALRQECGRDFIIGLKLPGDDGLENSIGAVEAGIIADLLTKDRSVDYVCFANGAHGKSLDMHTPDRFGPRLPYRDLMNRLRRSVNGVPLMALGRITDPAEAHGILEKGEAELIGLGRPLIADPAWPIKAASGRTNDIRYCLSCNTCWDIVVSHHAPLKCVNNPRVGDTHEVNWWPTRVPRAKRVVIVGAGIAGMEAAWVAGARGHDVTVFCSSAQVGGKAWLRSHFPGGEEVSSIYDYQTVAAQRAGVKIELGIWATTDDIIDLNPDSVILATGATMIAPAWLPDEIKEQSLIVDLRSAMVDLIGVTARQSGTAVIYDMDHTDGVYACAEHLAKIFDRVVILTPRDSLAFDGSLVARQTVFRRLSVLGVETIPLVEPVWNETMEDGELSYQNIYSKKLGKVGNVSFLSYATPRARNDEMKDRLVAAGIETFTVGDCSAPLEMLNATASGHELGSRI
jgi:dimethylglycine catabolism A